jgi:uncharacterized protein (TIGR02145 family)/uncharacterized repeat protein (TIGR02543 family)
MKTKKLFTVIMLAMLGFASINAQTSTTDPGVVINGVTWATRNVDAPGTFAASPEATGKFYQWNRNIAWAATGSVSGWDDTDAEGDTWDAATDPSPAGWRVPTKADFDALRDLTKVSRSWTPQNGVEGCTFTDIATGNTLFMPLAGSRNPFNGALYYAGTDGYYWSNTFSSSATHFRIYLEGVISTKAYRRNGFTVRSVSALTTYTVTFNSNGGTPTPPSQTVAEGGKATTPSPAPTRAGYTLTGWNNGATPWDFGTSTVTANITLTAQWTATFYTLTGTAPNLTLTITGTGAMPDYTAGTLTLPWYSYRNQITTIIIEDGITAIGNNAFYELYKVTSVTVGSSVTSIGDGAFFGCVALPSITLPTSVTAIGMGAFSGCDGLTGTFTIPNLVTTIEAEVFSDCSGLTSVNFGNSVTSIGASAFYNCNHLAGTFTIPNSVTTIGAEAFTYCEGLTSLNLGNSLSAIGYRAFADCTGLTSITAFTATPPTLEEDVFDDVTLSDITLTVPASSVAAYNAADVWKEMNVVGAAAAGINDIQANNRLQIFVNNGELTITSTSPSKGGDVNKVTIIDLSGRTVLNYKLRITKQRSAVANYGDATINVSGLPQGVYLVRVDGQSFKVKI